MKHRYIRPAADIMQLSEQTLLANSDISIYHKELGVRHHYSLWDDDDLDTDTEDSGLSVTF